MLDLSTYDSIVEAQETGIDVEIKGPDRRTKIGLTIKVAGPDSDRQKEALRALMNARLSAEDAAPISADDIEKNEFAVLAKATISWSPDPTVNGEQLPCNEKNARIVYTKYPFIFEQVRAKAGNRAAFMKGSA